MDNNRKEFVFVIGKSEGMNQNDMIDGLNSIVEEQKALGDKSTYSLMLFDRQCRMSALCREIRKMRKYSAKTYSPGGESAIMDAIGFALRDVGEKLAETCEEERPCNVAVIIIGEKDNASTHFDKDMVTEMINVQRYTYKWDFVIYSDGDLFDIHKGGELKDAKKMFRDINNYITAVRK